MIKLNSPFFDKKKYPVTQGFGENPQVYRRFGLPGHNGLDFGCPEDTKLVACANGRVIISKKHKAYGNLVKIKHNSGYFSLYCHLNKRLVSEGEMVKAGDLIGLSGSTGFSTGPHLHFGLQSALDGTKPYNYYIDPKKAFSLKKKSNTIKTRNTTRSTSSRNLTKKTSTRRKPNRVVVLSSRKKTTASKKVLERKIFKKHIFNKNINYKDRNKEVIELQKRLKKEGFFHYPRFTEYYGSVTRKAVLDYQLAKGIVKTPRSIGAGRLGPSTRKSLNK